MKKMMSSMLMLVLACAMSAVAQTGASSDATMNKDHMDKDHMGKTKTMTGCIAEKDGKYWLKTGKHPMELMSSEDLKPHIGHKVTVTGTVEKMAKGEMGEMKSDKMEDKMDKKSDDTMADSSMKNDKMEDKMDKKEHRHHERMEHMKMMNVSSMTMVSETCDMGAMKGMKK